MVSCFTPVSAKRTGMLWPSAQPLSVGRVLEDGDLVGMQVAQRTVGDAEVGDLLHGQRISG